MLLDAPTLIGEGLPVSPPETNDDWLTTAAAQGHGAVAYQLALTSRDPAERRYWLREAAHENYPPAMYAFAWECVGRGARTRWLRRAARAGHPAALRWLDAPPLPGRAPRHP